MNRNDTDRSGVRKSVRHSDRTPRAGSGVKSRLLLEPAVQTWLNGYLNLSAYKGKKCVVWSLGSNEKILVRLRLCLSYNDENTKQPQIKLTTNLNIQNDVFICVPHKLLLLLQLHQHPIAVLGVEEHVGLKVKVYYLKSLGWVTILMLLLPVMTNKFELIEWFCQYEVQSSGISSSKESVNVAFFSKDLSVQYPWVTVTV